MNVIEKFSCCLAVLGVMFVLVSGAMCDDYEHSWSSADSGGVISSGGDFELTGTFGQADVGVLKGDDFTLTGGFFSDISGAADLDFDWDVDLMDFGILGNQWLQAPGIPSADIGPENGDGAVDSLDLVELAEHWLKGTEVYVVFYDVSLDSDPGWTTEGQWAFGEPAGAGGAAYGNSDPGSGFTGSNVYGVNLDGDYDARQGGPYCLTAGPFGCRGYGDVHLSFARWLNTDVSAYVVSKVEASTNAVDWTVVWQHTAAAAITDDAWQIVQYDISRIADNQDMVYIRWSYEILNERAYPYSGWNIDDVQLSGI